MKKLLYILLFIPVLGFGQAVDWDSTEHVLSTSTTDYIPIFMDTPSKAVKTMRAEYAFPWTYASNYLRPRNIAYNLMLGTNSNYAYKLYVSGNTNLQGTLTLSSYLNTNSSLRFWDGSAYTNNYIDFYGNEMRFFGPNSKYASFQNQTFTTGTNYYRQLNVDAIYLTPTDFKIDSTTTSNLGKLYVKDSDSSLYFGRGSTWMKVGEGSISGLEIDLNYCDTCTMAVVVNPADSTLYWTTMTTGTGSGVTMTDTDQISYGVGTNEVAGSNDLTYDGDSLKGNNLDYYHFSTTGNSSIINMDVDEVSMASESAGVFVSGSADTISIVAAGGIYLNGVEASSLGGGSGTVTTDATQVAYGTGTNEVGGEAAFTYTAGTNTLAVGNVTVSDSIDVAGNATYTRFAGISHTGKIYADSAADASFALTMELPKVEDRLNDLRLVGGDYEIPWYYQEGKQIKKVYGIKAIPRLGLQLQALMAGIEMSYRYINELEFRVDEQSSRIEVLESELHKLQKEFDELKRLVWDSKILNK